MQRYFIELTKQEMDETPDFQITGEDVHHIANVMRMSAGDRIICCSKDGHEALCLLKEVLKIIYHAALLNGRVKTVNCL